jgi:hypothetical protein
MPSLGACLRNLRLLWPRLPRAISEGLAVMALMVVLILWSAAFANQVPNYNYSDSFGPTLAELGEFTLVPDSAVTWFYQGAPTVLPWLLAEVCVLTGATPEGLHAAITTVTLILALLGLGFAAAAMSNTAWSAALTAIAVPFSWPFAQSIGYSGPFWTGVATAGYWGVGWACAVWGLWFGIRSQGIASYVPFALTGLVLLAHPTWGLILLSVLAAGEAITAWFADDRAATLRKALVRLALAVAIGAPQFWLIATNLSQGASPADLSGWWPLIQFRKSFHFYIWDGAVPLGRLAKLLLLSGLSIAAAWPHLPLVLRLRALATAISVAMITVFAYVVMEILASRMLSALVLTRSLQLLSGVCVALIVGTAAAAVFASVGWRAKTTALLLWAAMIAVMVPTQAPGYATVAGSFSALLPPDIRAIGDDSLSFAITVLALAGVVALRSQPALIGDLAQGRLVTVGAATAVVLALAMVKLPMIPRFHGAAAPTDTWRGLTDFIRAKTPRDTLLVVPPYPYSIASARRSYIQDYSLLGAAVYNPPMTSFELKVLKTLYEVDIEHMSHPQIRAYLDSNQGILCILERAYRKLVASESRVSEVKAAFPSAAYLVGFKPGVTPLEWSCGAYDGPVLPLPIAYQNAEYVLYDIRRLAPASAAKPE